MTRNILLGGLLLLGLTACNKEVDELPPLTETGANTFGAKVNGVYWVPARFGILPADDLLEARFNSPGSLLITAKNFSASPKETQFEIQIVGVDGPGTYLLNKNVVRPSADGFAYYVRRVLTPEDEWITDPQYTGTVTLTKLDTHNKIVSGTFEFTAGSMMNAGSVLTVTDGRFDLKYR